MHLIQSIDTLILTLASGFTGHLLTQHNSNLQQAVYQYRKESSRGYWYCSINFRRFKWDPQCLSRAGTRRSNGIVRNKRSVTWGASPASCILERQMTSWMRSPPMLSSHCKIRTTRGMSPMPFRPLPAFFETSAPKLTATTLLSQIQAMCNCAGSQECISIAEFMVLHQLFLTETSQGSVTYCASMLICHCWSSSVDRKSWRWFHNQPKVKCYIFLSSHYTVRHQLADRRASAHV